MHNERSNGGPMGGGGDVVVGATVLYLYINVLTCKINITYIGTCTIFTSDAILFWDGIWKCN